MYQNELYHYGVKGMKWGVRRSRDYGGVHDVTSVSKRKLKKQFKKATANMENLVNSQKVGRKVVSEIDNSKEGKTLQRYNKNMVDLQNSLVKATGNPKAQVVYTKADVDIYNKAAADFDKRKEQIIEKYKNEMAGAALKDLGYKDTATGRDYLIKLGLV